jgi:hypothetical protein
MLDAITTRAGASANIRIYDGTRPATGGAGTTQLALLVCNATFAPAASGGVLTLNAIANDASADATGTATWGRLESSGATHVFDFSVGTSGTDLIMSTAAFVIGAVISITSATITMGNP